MSHVELIVHPTDAPGAQANGHAARNAAAQRDAASLQRLRPLTFDEAGLGVAMEMEVILATEKKLMVPGKAMAHAEDDINVGAHRHPPLEKLSSAMDIFDGTSPDQNTLLQVESWSDEKLTRFVEEFPPQKIPDIIRMMRALGWSAPECSYTFRNLFYKKDGTTLVNGVSGYLKPGMMVAVMGEGATPLFEVLAGRTRGGTIFGERLINGRAPDQSFTQLVGLVEKDDVHLPTLTVRETLLFSALLRNPRHNVAPAHRKLRVEVVMKLLGLRHQADTVVGDANIRGISGGEKRRLSVAVEIMAGHSLLIADLPTNGLDSANALKLVTQSRFASKAGISSMYSLVQPSPEILNTFDKVMLLSRGSCVYFGSPVNALRYFMEMGFRRPAKKSLPDFLEEVTKTPERFYTGISPKMLHVGDPKDHKEDDDDDRHIDMSMTLTTNRDAWTVMCKTYKASKDYHDLGQTLWMDLEPAYDVKVTKPIPKYHTTLYNQVRALTKRQFYVTLRNKAVFLGGIMRAIFVGLVVGTVFYQLNDGQTAGRSRIGLLFYILSFFGMQALQTIPLIMEQRQVFYMQKNGGYFRPGAYYWSTILTTTPLLCIETFIFLIICYGLTGLGGVVCGPQFWYLFIVMMILNLTGRAFAYTLTMCSPNATMAQTIVPVFMVMFLIFCGFLVPRDSIPNGWIWMYYISFFTWAIRGIALNEYQDLSLSCGPTDLIQLPGTPFTACPLQSGYDVLRQYNMDDTASNAKWLCFLWLCLFYIFYNLTAWLVTIFVDKSGETTVLQFASDRPTEELASVVRGATKLTKLRGATIEWHNLKYEVDVPSKENPRKMVRKVLLNEVYGYAKPGTMTALMGASGAGKSTLLDVLAGIKTGGYITGTLKINGHERDANFNRIAGYVEQFDSHMESATVREAIMFSAQLRLPSTMSLEDKNERVESVMRKLDLLDVSDRIIGSPAVGGLSPELRKKVTIAVELVMEPLLLFLDEPTTGLDSAAAMSVMTTVRKLAREISVLCTIHQPSEELVAQFDNMLLLQPGGRVVYFGPIANMDAYFEKQQLGKREKGRNVADFALEIIQKAKDSDAKADELFLNSPEGQEVQQALKKGLEQSDVPPPKFDSPFATDMLFQFLLLTKRFWLHTIRDRVSLIARLGAFVFVGFVIGTMYFQTPHDQSGTINRVAIFYLILLFSFFSAGSSIPKVVDLRTVYFRESKSKMYTPGTYFWARTVADIPIIIVQSFAFCVICYWAAGLNDTDNGARFGLFYMMHLVITLSAFGFFELMATIAPVAELANVLGTVVLTLSMLFTGFLVVKDGIPDPWIFMYYINVFRYPLFFLASNELGGLLFDCPNNDGAVFVPKSALPSCVGQYNNPSCYVAICPVTSGEQLMSRYSMDRGVIYTQYLIVTLAFMVFYRLAGYWAHKKINHVKR